MKLSRSFARSVLNHHLLILFPTPPCELDSCLTTNVPLLLNDSPPHHKDPLSTPSFLTYSESRNLKDSDKQWKPSKKTLTLSFPKLGNLSISIRKTSDFHPPTVPFLLHHLLSTLSCPPLNLLSSQLLHKREKLLISLWLNLLTMDFASNVLRTDTGMLIVSTTPTSIAVNQHLDITQTTAQSSKTLQKQQAMIGTITRTIVDGILNMMTASLEMTDMPILQGNLTEVEGNLVKFLA